MFDEPPFVGSRRPKLEAAGISMVMKARPPDDTGNQRATVRCISELGAAQRDFSSNLVSDTDERVVVVLAEKPTKVFSD